MINRTLPSMHLLLLSVLALLIGGCQSLGPTTVARDRFNYSNSIGDSWKRMTLLNIVKLRYVDPPIFVDVGQIVAGYSLEASADVTGEIATLGGGNTLGIGASGTYNDRPTITYTPLTGNKFIRSLMTPLTPESVFFTIQSGWPADGVLLAAVSTINGLRNRQATIHGTTPADADFLKVLALIRKIQVSGGVAFRIKQDAQKQQTALLVLRQGGMSEAEAADVAELRRLLGLNPKTSEFKLVFGAIAANDSEIAVLTCSIIQIMATMAAEIDAPARDVAEGRAAPGWESSSNAQGSLRMIEIHSSTKLPADAYAAVQYRGHWFWISDRDLKSKRTFAFMMMLFTLAETGDKEPPPLITIPAR